MPASTELPKCVRCGAPLPYAGLACPNCGQLARVQNSSGGYLVVAWIVVSGVLLAGVMLIATVSYLNRRLLRCEAYRKSLDIALSSVDVQENLGNGIQVRWPTVGYLFPFQNSQFAEWSVELVGSRGRGHLYGVATQVSGVWDFSRLVFLSAKGAGKLDLTPVHPLQLPSVPSKNVYLVPIGLAEGESILWAPAYYKSKLGVDLTLLPAIPLDPKLIDPQRNQLNSEQCIEFLAEKFRSSRGILSQS